MDIKIEGLFKVLYIINLREDALGTRNISMLEHAIDEGSKIRFMKNAKSGKNRFSEDRIGFNYTCEVTVIGRKE